jgi:hypothetical protein
MRCARPPADQFGIHRFKLGNAALFDLDEGAGLR